MDGIGACSKYHYRDLHRAVSGFTLIELIVVMMIVGILAALSYIMLQGPVRMYASLGPRADLTAAAESALQRMTREIRLALPNSVRLNAGGTTVEFLRATEGGRYRVFPNSGGKLDLAANADTFDVLGGLVVAVGSIDAMGASSSDCINGNSDCLVIYNTGSPGSAPGGGSNSYNAYLGPGNPGGGGASDFYGNVASISGATATTLSFDNSDLGSWHFPTGSPEHRFYIVDTPVRYVCNTGTGQITRMADYSLEDDITNAITPSKSNLLVDHVASCSFKYNAVSSTRSGLVVLEITLTSDDGQSVTLMQQAVVSNVP